MKHTPMDWIDERPDCLKATGLSGWEYRLWKRAPGDWSLHVTPAAGGQSTVAARGALHVMKAWANQMESDARPAAARTAISWTRISNGHWWGTTASGPAYKIVRVGRVWGSEHWRLEAFANEDATHGEWIDEGSCATLKRRAAAHAAELANEHIEARGSYDQNPTDPHHGGKIPTEAV